MSTQIVTTDSLTLYPTKAPALPLAPDAYTREYHNQLNNVFRLYFNQIDRYLAQFASQGNGAGVFLPNGAFHDTTTQTAASTTSAYVVTFDATDYSNGITLVSNSQLTVDYDGRYNIQFSVQMQNTTNVEQDIDVWFRKNGTDIADSNSRFGLSPRKSLADPFHMIGTVNIFVDLNANDYVEIVWCTTSIGADLRAYAAGVTPTRPAIPSVIATMNFVSAIT